jgi:hypothetical protein
LNISNGGAGLVVESDIAIPLSLDLESVKSVSAGAVPWFGVMSANLACPLIAIRQSDC